MEQSSFTEAACCAATKEYANTLWNQRVYYHVHKEALYWSLSPVRSIQSIPPHPSSLRSMLILSTHLHLGAWSSYWSLSCLLSHKYLVCIHLNHIHATCFANHTLLDTWQTVKGMKLLVMHQSSVTFG
jgi:hypothetical protein